VSGATDPIDEDKLCQGRVGVLDSAKGKHDLAIVELVLELVETAGTWQRPRQTMSAGRPEEGLGDEEGRRRVSRRTARGELEFVREARVYEGVERSILVPCACTSV
jgi:hypothetical protein